jgi:uncharacterized protein
VTTPIPDDRFTRFPRYLAERARTLRVGEIPVLLAHPDWNSPAPTVIWLHGRTSSKEIDPGRYLRWIRAGIAACAIDLPGHGERADEPSQTPRGTLDVLARTIVEIDQILAWVRSTWDSGEHAGLFDPSRLGIGGMSLGGMATLRRLCEPHPFRCAAVEGTTGWLGAQYFPERVGLAPRPEPSTHDPEAVARLDPWGHLVGFEPIPLLALHSRTDRMVPIAGMERFIERLRERYVELGAGTTSIEWRTWEQTGAPEEHLGFGRYASDAKTLETAFFSRWLGARAPTATP